MILLSMRFINIILSISVIFILLSCSSTQLVRDGYGVYEKDGFRYEGQFRNYNYHGQGIATWDDGERYDGEWKDSKRNGQGTNTWPNGMIYEGQWKNNLMEGRGVATNPNGDKRYVQEGYFKDNTLVRGKQFTKEEYAALKEKEREYQKRQEQKDRQEQKLDSAIKKDEYDGEKTIPDIDEARASCLDIGFKKGTEEFGECVLDLTE
jgi:hypothetical protein